MKYGKAIPQIRKYACLRNLVRAYARGLVMYLKSGSRRLRFGTEESSQQRCALVVFRGIRWVSYRPKTSMPRAQPEFPQTGFPALRRVSSEVRRASTGPT